MVANIEYLKNRVQGLQRGYLESLGDAEGEISLLQPITNLINGTELVEMYANIGYFFLKEKGLCTEDDYTSYYQLMVLYGVSFSGIIYVYDKINNTYGVYTSSIPSLRALQKAGVIKKTTEELDRLEERLLFKSRISSKLKENKLVAYRLDRVVEDGVVTFDIKMPRGDIDVSNCLIVDYNSVVATYQYLDELMSNDLLEVVQGEKIRYVTKNRGILNTAYREDRINFLLSMPCQPLALQYYVPSYGANINTLGVTNIHLERVDRFKIVRNIDRNKLLEDLNVSYDMAKDFFLQKYQLMDESIKLKIGVDLGVLEGGTVTQRVREMYSKDVYEYMKKHQEYFNLDEYKRLPSKYGDNYIELDVRDMDEAKLKGMLSQDILKIVYYNKTKGFGTVICTNSKGHLSRLYGTDYVKHYESAGIQFREIKRILEAKKEITYEEFAGMCKEYGVETFLQTIESDSMLKRSLKTYFNKEKIVAMLDIYIDKSNVKDGVITVRSCDAYLGEDGTPVGYYKALKVSNIVSITQLT